MIVEKTHKILKENNIKAKKMFGQNFLTDKKVLEDIINASSLSSDDYVIEIGPGLGSLTEMLCKGAKKVLCYEIDRDLAAMLPERLKEFNNFEIIGDDYLRRNVSKDIDDYFGTDVNVKVIANIPYNITSPIMLSLLKERRVNTIVLMVQKELAERFSSQPSSKEYGSISAYLSYMGDNDIVRIVKRNCFEPVPNVDSAVYRFIRRNDDSDEAFLIFLRKAFEQKRKKLINNLSKDFPKDNLISILNEMNLDENIRAEAMSADQLYKMYQKVVGDKDEN